MITPFHAKYYANELFRKKPNGSDDRISSSLFDAALEINPHQIDAALFAFKSPLSKGVLLADEVGLGKTIEAGLVMCQLWAERKRRQIVICPAALRKQWSLELSEKFNLPTIILETRTYNDYLKSGMQNPMLQDSIIIMSYNYASKMDIEVGAVPWNVVVIDAYEIIGLNQKSLINQWLDWLRPIFLTQKEAMKMSIRRFYEQRRKSAA